MPDTHDHTTHDHVGESDLAGSLLRRCHNLLNELEEFRSFVESHREEQQHAVDIRKFQTSVKTEHKSLQRLSEADPTAEKTIHTLRSSNLPYYAATWEAAKSCQALVTFYKRFHWDDRPADGSQRMAGRTCALVDIVARDGEEWIKVSTVSEDRLKYELAKAEWEAADSDFSEDDGGEEGSGNGITNGVSNTAEESHLARIELVRVADDLSKASKAQRIHYKYPQVRFVLPKIPSDSPRELLPIFDRIRSTGATIDLRPQAPSLPDLIANVFPKLLPSPHPPLTDTLNIDCTILLALVSDLSHTANHPVLPGYNAAITRQIELETRDHLLPKSLWPAMADKELVCTEEAASRMKEIVDTIGMPNEKLRTALILVDRDVDYSDWDPEFLRQEFAKYSDHKVPSTWRLPIRIVHARTSALEINEAIEAGTLPSVTKQVAGQLTDINRSVFLYGWMQGITTVSSNRTVAKQIESIIEKHGDGAMGPEIWLREPARSLLGKEKERRK